MYSFCEPFFIRILNNKGTGVFENNAGKKSATHTEDRAVARRFLH